jgi:hypothetical protein
MPSAARSAQFLGSSVRTTNIPAPRRASELRLSRVPMKDERGTTRGRHSLSEEYGGGRRRDGAA